MFTYMNKKLLAQNKALQAEHERLKTEVFLAKQHQSTLENSLNALRAAQEAVVENLEGPRRAYKERQTLFANKAKFAHDRRDAARNELELEEDKLSPLFYKQSDYMRAIDIGARYV